MSVRRKSGFTLIELLVVIAIIAILAAILFPVFARARETARKASCQSNLKQCAQALKMYVDDYDGEMPSSYRVSGANPTAASYQTFGCRLTGTADTDISAGYPGTNRVTWAQMLYDNMRSKNVMWCPSDSTAHDAGNVISYWYKWANDYAWGQGKKKMSDYGYESDQVAFFEHNGWHFSDQSGIHAKLEINAAFLDSHVEKVTLPSSAPSTPVTAPANATSANAPFYYNIYVTPATGVEVPTGETWRDATSITVNAAGQGWDPSMNYDKL